MSTIDLNAVIRQLVEETVVEVLGPYATVLDRMATLLGNQPASPRASSRRAAAPAAPVATRKPSRRRKTSRRATARSGSDASRFHEGQVVRYRQGRGEFEAKVIGIDSSTNMVRIQRTSDNKQVDRPADKIYGAA